MTDTPESRLTAWVADKLERYAAAPDVREIYRIVDEVTADAPWLKANKPAIYDQLVAAGRTAFARITEGTDA